MKTQINWKEKLPLVPRVDVKNDNLDPAFERLENDSSLHTITKQAVFDVFTPDEVVEIVNRYIYYIEYQRRSHTNFNQNRRDKLAPVKAKVKELFHVSWAKATPAG